MCAETSIDVARGPIARIKNAEGVICGTGFLIGHRHIMTCAHVVSDALGRDRGSETAPDAPVRLDLPFRRRFGLVATVVAWRPMRQPEELEQDRVSDIAVLELLEPVPGGVDSRNARLSFPTLGTTFHTYGFPAGMDNGTEASGDLRVVDSGGWQQIRDVQDHGYFVERGFSGAPVFDNGEGRLVGMVVAAEQDAPRRMAFVIPTSTLCRAWPLLARPYKGLFAFAEDDASLFFGRERFIEELAAKIHERHFLTLIGPSGSGKSSVVMAGLVPRLRSAGGWAIVYMRPGARPLYRLAYAVEELTSAGTDSAGEVARRATEFETLMRKDPVRIVEHADTILHRLSGIQRILLVIDQFEELFTHDVPQRSGGDAIQDKSQCQNEFVAIIEAIVQQKLRDPPIRAVATLRADFLGRALQDLTLAELMRDSDVKLGPMTPTEISEAVAAPAAQFGVGFEPGLVVEIVTSITGAMGGLPMLQFALDRLWRRQTDPCLTMSTYVDIGGVDGALADHAEASLGPLDDDEKAIVRRVFTRLVRLATPGEPTEDTRAVVSRDEIGEDDWRMVQTLSDERLIMTGRDPGTGKETAEVVHEALIRSWPRLRNWLNEDREFALWRQRLRTDVIRWDGTNKDALLRGDLLTEAQGWIKSHPTAFNDNEMVFINASSKWERITQSEKTRIHRRLNILWCGIAVVSILALVGTGYFARATLAKQIEAETAAKEAKGRQLASDARNILRELGNSWAVERAAALAIEGWRLHRTSTAYQAAETALRQLPLYRVKHGGHINSMSFNRDSTRVITASEDGTVRIFDKKSGIESFRIDNNTPVWLAGYVLDGTMIATSGADGTVRLLDAASGVEINRFSHGGFADMGIFNADFSRIATVNARGTIRILDTKTGRKITRIAHAYGTTGPRFSFSDIPSSSLDQAFAYSPTGSHVATSSADGTARIFDAVSGNELHHFEHAFEAHDPALSLMNSLRFSLYDSFSFSPDGSRIAFIGSKDAIRVFDITSGQEISRIRHGGSIGQMAFSPNGAHLAISADTTIRIANIDAKNDYDESERFITAINIQTGSMPKRVDKLSFSPDGNRLLVNVMSASGEMALLIFASPSGDLLARLDDCAFRPGQAFSLDGEYVVCAGWSNNANVYHIGSAGGFLKSRTDGSITEARFSPNGVVLATVDIDGIARVFIAESGEEFAKFSLLDREIDHIAVSPDGTKLATSSKNGIARLFTISSGEEIARFEHDEPIQGMAFSSNGKRFAVIRWDGPTTIVDMAKPKQITRIVHSLTAAGIGLSPDGTKLAAAIASWDNTVTGISGLLERAPSIAGLNSTVKIFDAASGKAIAEIDHINNIVSTFAFSPDGTLFASGDEGGGLWINSATSGKEIGRYQLGDPVSQLAFSPDGAQLVVSSPSNIVRKLESFYGKEVFNIPHGGRVDAVAFRPDGSELATASGDRFVRIFDAVSGDEIARIQHDELVYSVAYSVNGDRLMTYSGENTALSFDGEPSALFNRLCQERAGRNLTRDEWRRYIGDPADWRATCPHWRTPEE